MKKNLVEIEQQAEQKKKKVLQRNKKLKRKPRQKKNNKATRSQIIAAVVQQLSYLPEKDVGFGIINAVDYMTRELVMGRRVEIRGFGSFFLRYHKARVARNPKTGESVMVKPRSTVRFKVGKELRDRVNNQS